MRERDVSSSSSSSSGSSITRYDAIFQAATELVEQHAKNHGSTGIDFSLMLWNDDAEWIFRNCTAQKCLKRLVKAKASNKPCGGTNFSNPFRLLRQSIVASAEFVSTSVVIFLSDGRPGDLRSIPPLGGKMVQLSYKSHGQTYDSVAVHLEALQQYIQPNGALHFVGIHKSGYPWLRHLADKYNGCFHQSSLNFDSGPSAAPRPSGASNAQNTGQIVATGSNTADSDSDGDEIELIGAISAERRIKMNLANADVVSVASQTQLSLAPPSSIRDTFLSLSQSITTVHETASQRAHKERRVVIKAEHTKSATPTAGKKYTATKLILRGDKFEPLPASKNIVVWLSSNPFAQGGERNVYRMREEVPDGQATLTSFLVNGNGTDVRRYTSVAKESRKELPYKDRIIFHKMQITSQERAQRIADAFNAKFEFITSSYKIKFIRCELLRVNDAQAGSGNYRYLSVEEALDGGDTSLAPYPYVKYNSNNGYVLNCNSAAVTDGSVKHASEIAQAFSHFSYLHSNKQEMIVDIQGCLLKLTDPQIHSLQRAYGCGDRGEQGFKDFFKTHKCGPTCKTLHLPTSCQEDV